MGNAKSTALFYGAIVLAVVALLLSIYCAIPNINHIVIPAYAEPTKVHYKYVAIFGLLSVLGLIGALVTRPKAIAK